VLDRPCRPAALRTVLEDPRLYLAAAGASQLPMQNRKRGGGPILKKIGSLFGCDIYKAVFYRPRDFVFMSREDADRLKQIELVFLQFISAVKTEVKKPGT
jgi:hypothetical protein